MQLDNVWAVVFLLIILMFIVLALIKRDQIPSFFEDEMVLGNFNEMDTIYKVSFLSNQLFELRNLKLCPSDTKVALLRYRFRELDEIITKIELLKSDEQHKCNEGMLWLDEQDEW